MIVFDKDLIKQELTIDQIFNLLTEWGGEPEYSPQGLVATTICHNMPGEGSRKLYYYTNSNLFKCYTGCDSTFDIFELCMKVYRIQKREEIELYSAIRIIAAWGGFSGEYDQGEKDELPDWDYFDSRSKEKKVFSYTPQTTMFDSEILTRFNYKLKITPWLKEGISESVLQRALIGFYPGGDQITIPHFNVDGQLIGIRGRTLCKEDAERFGKYRPLLVNRQLYNHPLSLHLYNLNNSKQNIASMRKAIVFESEKSCLKYQTYFGFDNDITTACCGSNISDKQIELLRAAGAKEIIIAFDRQFQEIGDKEFKKLKENLLKIHAKYKNYVQVSFIFDKNKITGYKQSPIDEGPEKFLQLFKERIVL